MELAGNGASLTATVMARHGGQNMPFESTDLPRLATKAFTTYRGRRNPFLATRKEGTITRVLHPVVNGEETQNQHWLFGRKEVKSILPLCVYDILSQIQGGVL